MADIAAIGRAYDTQVDSIRGRIEKFGTAMWESLPDYRDDSIDSLVSAIVPRVQAGQLQIAQLTNAYLVSVAREMGLPAVADAVDAQWVTGSRGVDPDVVYTRPGAAVYAALSEGKPMDVARKMGRLRLLDLIGGDLQMAKRNQSQRTLQKSGVETYRRVLSGRENCGLCSVASTQRYWVKDLLPIHPGCDCRVEPLPPGSEFPQVIEPEQLEEVHAAVARHFGLSEDEIDRGARSPDYRKITIDLADDGTASVSGTSLIAVREHGEYGPVLTWANQKFTGPDDLH